ncbi:NPH3 family [Musa troglodytarum]|uniref:NPH3 family n=1 Tax=Musa troglodytarum TaxID=320322 RepID=A0A9E7FM92_9LILI|nr:NPH3 family [Musa troglodytarum]
MDLKGEVNSRRLSSASHSSKLRVAKLIDGFLQEITKDENLPLEKLIAIVEAVSDFAKLNHDDFSRVIDIYLRVTNVDKGVPKVLIDRLRHHSTDRLVVTRATNSSGNRESYCDQWSLGPPIGGTTKTCLGLSFVHDASKVPVWPPPYIDPSTLLEDERISQVASHVWLLRQLRQTILHMVFMLYVGSVFVCVTPNTLNVSAEYLQCFPGQGKLGGRIAVVMCSRPAQGYGMLIEESVVPPTSNPIRDDVLTERPFITRFDLVTTTATPPCGFARVPLDRSSSSESFKPWLKARLFPDKIQVCFKNVFEIDSDVTPKRRTASHGNSSPIPCTLSAAR